MSIVVCENILCFVTCWCTSLHCTMKYLLTAEIIYIPWLKAVFVTFVPRKGLKQQWYCSFQSIILSTNWKRPCREHPRSTERFLNLYNELKEGISKKKTSEVTIRTHVGWEQTSHCLKKLANWFEVFHPFTLHSPVVSHWPFTSWKPFWWSGFFSAKTCKWVCQLNRQPGWLALFVQ